MVFLSFSAVAKSFACAIHKFQRVTSNNKAFCIDSALQNLVNCVATTKPKNLSLFDVFKKTRVARSTSSRFYDAF